MDSVKQSIVNDVREMLANLPKPVVEKKTDLDEKIKNELEGIKTSIENTDKADDIMNHIDVLQKLLGNMKNNDEEYGNIEKQLENLKEKVDQLASNIL